MTEQTVREQAVVAIRRARGRFGERDEEVLVILAEAGLLAGDEWEDGLRTDYRARSYIAPTVMQPTPEAPYRRRVGSWELKPGDRR